MWAAVLLTLNGESPPERHAPHSAGRESIGATSGFCYIEPFPVSAESNVSRIAEQGCIGLRKHLLSIADMKELLLIMARHGYALTLGLLFAEAIGFPVPAALALVTAGAAVSAHKLSGPGILVAAVIALLIGDTAQYWLGRYSGWGLLSFLCRLSMNPETCILRSAESFYKRGKTTLVVAKFIPGINTMAAPLAGSMKMRFGQFLRLDLAGTSLYALTYLLVGYVSRDFLAAVLDSFREAGRVMEAGIITALVIYVIYRIAQFQKYREYDVVPRVQVEQLAARLASEDSAKVLIVDVRSHGYYDVGAERIFGSIRIEPNNLDEEIKNLPKEKDIYLYCT